MNKKDLLKGFYKKVLLQDLQKLERQRKTIVLKIILGIVLPFFIITPGLIYVFIMQTSQPWYVLVPIFAVDVVALVYVYSLFGETRFYKNFKQQIIKVLIKFIREDFDYDNNLHVQIFEYNDSKIFDEVPIEFYGDDHVAGTIEGIEVEFSEIEARYADPAMKKQYGKYQFKGLFFVANTFKKFPAEFVIRSSGIPSDAHETYIVDNAQFNEAFDVEVISGKDKMDNIFTPEFIQMVLEYQSTVHNDISISVVGSKIFVAFLHDKDLFEPQVTKTLLDYDMVYEYFTDLYYPLTVIEDFIVRQKTFAF